MISGELKEKAIKRLQIIEGQVRGLQKAVGEGKYCIDVLTQISAVHEVLRGVGKVVVRNYLETCATIGIKGRKPEMYYHEIMKIIYKITK